MRNFILGTDWWTDCDDAVAIRLLSRAHKKGEICLLGIGINACMEYSVRSLENFLTAHGVSVPVGIDCAATDFGGNPPYQKNLSMLYDNKKSNFDAPSAVGLYRKLLSECDGKAEILEIGFPQILSELLESRPDGFSPLSGFDLVKEKVSKLWVMAGKWDVQGGKENNFIRNDRSRRAGHILCEKCPVPITFLGYEVGFSVITGGKLSKHDVLHKVLCDHGSENGRSSWDPMLVQLALTGDEQKAGYKVVRGKASVNPEDGSNTFAEDANGCHSYVIKVMDDEYYENTINALIDSSL